MYDKIGYKPMQIQAVPSKQEVEGRIKKLFETVNAQNSDWDAVFLVDKINQYYLTGTMQDGLFVLKKDGSYAYFARRSFERAKEEAIIDNIYPMGSYRDVLSVVGGDIHNILIETEIVTHGMLARLKKHFDIHNIGSVDRMIAKVRSVKSEFELLTMEESGRQHKYLFESIIPHLLKEGMNEAELSGLIYAEMVKLGYHGVSRFAMFQTEMILGQMGFGTNSLCASNFDGPGGMKGMHPAVPIIGDRNRTLKKGDLVFIDIGYGVNGYHTDRTQIYMFGANPADELVHIHKQCMDIQKKTAALLKPGNIPSEIYNEVMGELSPEFLQNFMGFGDRKVKFLGHGVGLQIDESPVIANGFNEPLVENIAIAIEPKKGVPNYGIVGVEDTYIVTKDGGKCITGGEKEIMVV